jgi:hypothetical protein
LHFRDASARDLGHQLPDPIEILVTHPLLYEAIGSGQLQSAGGFLGTQRADPSIELLRWHFVTQKAAAALPGYIHFVLYPEFAAKGATADP